MKITPIEATPLQLDWLVATLEDWKPHCTRFPWDNQIHVTYWIPSQAGGGRRKPLSPTSIWEQGGPIIERENISLDADNSPLWLALSIDGKLSAAGASPLIAAMRCHVMSKLGTSEVWVPDELA